MDELDLNVVHVIKRISLTFKFMINYYGWIISANLMNSLTFDFKLKFIQVHIIIAMMLVNSNVHWIELFLKLVSALIVDLPKLSEFIACFQYNGT